MDLKLYLDELYWQAAQVVDGCEEIFAAHPLPVGGDEMLYSQPKTHRTFAMILCAAVNVDKLLRPPAMTSRKAKKRKGKATRGEAERAVHEQRSTALAACLKGLSLTELGNRSVRNSIEHFDEYLDALQLELRAKPGPVTHNLSVSSTDLLAAEGARGGPLRRSTLGGPMRHIRLYVARERAYQNFGARIDLQKLHTECKAILQRLEELDSGIKHVLEGTMVWLPPRTNRGAASDRPV